MTRSCILCGTEQQKNFSVFSFPQCIKSCKAWIDVIKTVKPNFGDGISVSFILFKYVNCLLFKFFRYLAEKP